MKAAWLVVLAACGRVGFDAVPGGDGGTDPDAELPGTPFTQAVDTIRSRFEDIARLPDGGVVIAGNVNPDSMLAGMPIPNAGNNDALVAVFAPDGTLRWLRTYGGPETDFIRGVGVAPDGTIYVAGEIDPGAAFDGMPAGNVDHDAFLASISAAGDLNWVRVIGGPTGTDSATFVRIAPDGDPIVGGSLDSDAFVARYSPANELRWQRTWGTAGVNRAWGATLDATTLYVTGAVQAEVAWPDGLSEFFGDQDGFIAALALDDGVIQWGDSWGGPDDDRGNDLAILDGQLVLIGYFADAIDLGVTPAQGGADIVFATWSRTGQRGAAVSVGTAGCDQGHSLRLLGDGAARWGGNFEGTLDLGGTTLTADQVDGVTGTVTSGLALSAGRQFGGAGDDTIYMADGDYVGGVLDDDITDSTCGSTFVGRGFVQRLAD